MSARRNKYNAIPMIVDGIRFPSQLQGKRYRELKLLEQAGEIDDLKIESKWELHGPNGTVIGIYRDDASYRDLKTGQYVVEDCKSPATATALYKWKKKHLKDEYGIEITEIEAKDVRS